MMERDTKMLRLRPAIQTASTAVSVAEQFQNQTLRPILKWQNELLVLAFQQYITQRKNVFDNLSREQKLGYIDHSVRTDRVLKNRLLGMIIGLFTTTECKNFLTEEAELTRRITTLLIQRLQSQLV